MSNTNTPLSEAARTIIELVDLAWKDFRAGKVTAAHLGMQEAQVLATLLVAERSLAQTVMEFPPSTNITLVRGDNG